MFDLKNCLSTAGTGLDVLVNNAGVMQVSKLANLFALSATIWKKTAKSLSKTSSFKQVR
jgi:NADP-dependent 3-hydroxy acid dehydrogenase YdfG